MFLPEGVDAGDDPSGPDCSEQECTDRLSIRIIRSDDDLFLGGSYRFAVGTIEDGEFFLDCHLPYPEAAFVCASGYVELLDVSLVNGGREIAISTSFAPLELTVVVEYNGFVIGERTVAPQYEFVYPNGPECEPVCLSAEEAIAVRPW